MNNIRPEITVINHYNIFPITGGGSIVIRDFYTALSTWVDVNIITFGIENIYKDIITLNEHLKVYYISLPEEIITSINQMNKEFGMNENTIYDGAPIVIREYHKNEYIKRKVCEIANNSSVVIAEHVFTWNLIKELFSKKHLWYRAQNIEYDYKSFVWNVLEHPQALLADVYTEEKDACENAELILTISKEEKQRFIDFYDVGGREKHFFVLGAGYSMPNTENEEYLKRNNDHSSLCGFYIGTDTPGTRQVLEQCIFTAQRNVCVKFIIAGTVCNSFFEKELPANIILMGKISDEEKSRFLKTCDFAINTVKSGAGVNIKMFEYFAYKIPVITSTHGIRGIDVIDGRDCLVTDEFDLHSAIKRLENMSFDEINTMVDNAYSCLAQKYSWHSLSKKIANYIYDINELVMCESEYMYVRNISTGMDGIRYIKNCTSNIYVRCLGNWGKCFIRKTIKSNLKIKAIIDNGVSLEKYEGIPVVNVASVKFNSDDIVIIAANKFKSFLKELLAIGISEDNIYIYRNNEDILYRYSSIEDDCAEYMNASMMKLE